jgi:hypothetical protein
MVNLQAPLAHSISASIHKEGLSIYKSHYLRKQSPKDTDNLLILKIENNTGILSETGIIIKVQGAVAVRQLFLN